MELVVMTAVFRQDDACSVSRRFSFVREHRLSRPDNECEGLPTRKEADKTPVTEKEQKIK
ncbi:MULTISPECIES: hypothetical protein [Bacillus]|uniref:hypothetical protein n=1 Tax=Bacillus TaxID=1386 RepID=UPI00047C6D7A|nr:MULTISPECIES: hypothetical protein [Bacillus]